MKIQATVEVTDERISGLICCGIECGASPWLQQIDFELADGVSIKDFHQGGRLQGETYWHWTQLVPLAEGCRLVAIDAEENKTVTLDRPGIERALGLMAEKHPQHFADFIDENDDATTGEVFLQLCFRGEVV